MNSETVFIATRGSALALAQANTVLAQCRASFPTLAFEIKIIKTTGDKLQAAALRNVGAALPKGLFTKELEVALLNHDADLAVHSLKDLPTELPAGLRLGATLKRADVRDVFIYRRDDRSPPDSAMRRRNFKAHLTLKDFPADLTVATSSTRRKAQLLAQRPDFNVVDIRGNVLTRLLKLSENEALDALVLAAAGLHRLSFTITEAGELKGEGVPNNLLAMILEPETMLPCVGQGAIGIEIREPDTRLTTICERLNHDETFQCVTAERAFLSAMGGGCQSPIGAHAEVIGDEIRLRVVSFRGAEVKRGEGQRNIREALELGIQLASDLGRPVE